METRVWNSDKAHSGIGFTVRHMIFAEVRGRFGAITERTGGVLVGERVDIEIEVQVVKAAFAQAA